MGFASKLLLGYQGVLFQGVIFNEQGGFPILGREFLTPFCKIGKMYKINKAGRTRLILPQILP